MDIAYNYSVAQLPRQGLKSKPLSQRISGAELEANYVGMCQDYPSFRDFEIAATKDYVDPQDGFLGRKSDLNLLKNILTSGSLWTYGALPNFKIFASPSAAIKDLEHLKDYTLNVRDVGFKASSSNIESMGFL